MKHGAHHFVGEHRGERVHQSPLVDVEDAVVSLLFGQVLWYLGQDGCGGRRGSRETPGEETDRGGGGRREKQEVDKNGQKGRQQATRDEKRQR